jgi:CO/xanthine dehydrogenase FAD-binding subunit
MRTVETLSPRTLEEALALKAEYEEGVLFLAGGTDVIPGIRSGGYKAERLLDLSHIAGLDQVLERGSEIHIGPLVTHAALENSSLVRTHLPILGAACGSIGSVQIRNRGTIGGNLNHASPAADTIPALQLLGAICEIRSSEGDRIVRMDGYCTCPGGTCLSPSEMLVGVRVQKMPPGARWFYRKLGQRRAMAIAKVSVGFLANDDGGVLRHVRIALGAVAPTVCGAPETAAFLEGKRLDKGVIAEAAGMIRAESRPIADVRSTVEYRRDMVGVLLAQGLRSLME